LRGENDVTGSFSAEDLVTQMNAGTLTPAHLVLQDTGQSRKQLENHWDFQWSPISVVPGLESLAPTALDEPTTALTKEELRESANQDMLVGGVICAIGIIITAATHLGIIAYGAVAFGAIQFIRGFSRRP
jgi:hypothetical protein